MISKCDIDPNTITNLNWDTAIVNEIPSRVDTTISIPEFQFSNEDCGLLSYTLSGQNAA